MVGWTGRLASTLRAATANEASCSPAATSASDVPRTVSGTETHFGPSCSGCHRQKSTLASKSAQDASPVWIEASTVPRGRPIQSSYRDALPGGPA